MSPKATILIVDDEPDVREVLEEYFVAHGYAAIGAENAGAARALAAQHAIDLALVDINMPGEDGLSLARHLRERYAKIAIVMLTSAGTVVDRIVGLEMGADDYVPKPFDPRELVARVKSVLRRTSSAGRADIGAERVRIGRCVLDLAAHRLTDETGAEVAMSPLEFDLLKALAEHPNRAALARTHPESEPATRLGPVRPQRGSAHHAVAQEDRARSRASAVHQDRAQRGLHLRAGRRVRIRMNTSLRATKTAVRSRVRRALLAADAVARASRKPRCASAPTSG